MSAMHCCGLIGLSRLAGIAGISGERRCEFTRRGAALQDADINESALLVDAPPVFQAGPTPPEMPCSGVAARGSVAKGGRRGVCWHPSRTRPTQILGT